MPKLIVEMEMPKFCIWLDGENEPHRCPLLNEDDDCVLQDSNIWMSWNEQYAHCPIKGVLPEQHGDLIDKETAKNAFDSSFLTFRMKDGETMRGFYQRTIDELPALIAEERKDNGTTAD